MELDLQLVAWNKFPYIMSYWCIYGNTVIVSYNKERHASQFAVYLLIIQR